MQTISTALRNAINAGNPQRTLLVFNDQEFSNEDISMSKGINLREEFNTEEDITIGACPSSTLSFDLLNDLGQVAQFEFGWFTAYIGAMITTGTPTEITRSFLEDDEWHTYAFFPLGTFYAEKPKYLNKNLITITAYDKMILLEKDMPSASALSLTYPTTIGTILSKIGTYCNVTVPNLFLNSTLEVASEPEELKKAKIREVVAWIAECACSIARFGRSGSLEFVWFTNTNLTFTESNYSKFEPAWYQTHPINGAYFRDTEGCTEQSEGVGKTNNYLIMDNPFLKGE